MIHFTSVFRLLPIFICSFWGCTKPLLKNNSGSSNNVKIYLAGTDDADYPVLFEGENKIKIDTNGKKGITPLDLVITGTDVYLTTMGGYWKNGVWTDLKKTCEKADASTTVYEPFVKNNDVYVGGWKQSALGNAVDTIRVWKNSKIVLQQTGSRLGGGNKLTVDDYGNIYYFTSQTTSSGGSFGSFWSSQRVAVQKNGMETYAGSFTSSQNSVFTSLDFITLLTKGYDVYLLNCKTPRKGVALNGLQNFNWMKNFNNINLVSFYSSQITLTVTGYFEENGILYTAGYDYAIYPKGKYWINNEEHLLFEVPGTNAPHIGNIVVKNGDIYVAGRENENSNTIYWKNDQPVKSNNKFKCTLIKVL